MKCPDISEEIMFNIKRTVSAHQMFLKIYMGNLKYISENPVGFPFIPN
jgi:hypothetical protein